MIRGLFLLCFFFCSEPQCAGFMAFASFLSLFLSFFVSISLFLSLSLPKSDFETEPGRCKARKSWKARSYDHKNGSFIQALDEIVASRFAFGGIATVQPRSSQGQWAGHSHALPCYSGAEILTF